MKLLLKGGLLIDPSAGTKGIFDLLIEAGRIAAVGGDLPAEGAEVVDCSGKVVAPGLVDMHVHLRDPGLEAKEDVVSGTQAAVAGGFTTVCCMANTKPVIDSSILVEGLRERARRDGAAHVGVIGAVTKGLEGKELAEIGDMKLAGAVAVSDDGHHVANSGLFKSALEYAAMFGCLVISHAEDETLVAGGHMHEGAVSSILGIPGRPAVAEEIAISRDIMLAEYAGAPIHIAHVSTKGSVEIIRAAKQRGVKVTAEATPHHLALTDEAVYGFNTAMKVNTAPAAGGTCASSARRLKGWYNRHYRLRPCAARIRGKGRGIPLCAKRLHRTGNLPGRHLDGTGSFRPVYPGGNHRADVHKTGADSGTACRNPGGRSRG